MNQLAHELASDVLQEQGIVARSDGDGFIVRTASGDLRCRRATSCLVEPRVGDLALVAATARGVCYVLAILERDETLPTTLAATGDLELSAKNGRVAISGADGVTVLSKTKVEVVTAEISLRALVGHLVVEELGLAGRKLGVDVERVKAFATSVDSVMGRLSQRVKRAYRFVEEADHLRAERIDYAATRTMNLHGENAVVTAEHVVKVDGEQILVG